MTNWNEQIGRWFALPTALWDRYGLMLSARAASLFSLPIEGGFWSSVMGQGPVTRFCSYALPFTLDLIADELVYRYGRIQQSVTVKTKKWRASRYILLFVVFNAAQSWGTAAWQLNNAMQPVHLAFPLLFALIQPVMGAGIAWTQAVQDGKFDEPEREKTEPKRKRGRPDVEWWRTRSAQLDGQRAQLTADDVRELVLSEWTDSPSPTTLYAWAQEARESVQ